jgi:hypothetical protein
MNEQTLLVLVLLHFNPNCRPWYKIRNSIFTTVERVITIWIHVTKFTCLEIG